jgi:hypothetical protein
MQTESNTPNIPGLLKLLVERAAGAATTEDIVSWAQNALELGDDSPSLRILAGLVMPADLSDVEFYFQRTLRELGWTLTDPEALMWLYARQIASDILRGAVPSMEGCRQLY